MASYAEISVQSNSTETAISTASSDFSNKVQVTVFDTNGTNTDSTPDHTNDHITIGTSGVYLVLCSVSFYGNEGQTISFAVFKNNGATQVTTRATQTAGGVQSIIIAGVASLTANDTIELWVQNEDATTNVIIEDASLLVTLSETV